VGGRAGVHRHHLHQPLQGAERLPPASPAKTPGRKLISERSNFPTDLYIAQSVCQEYGLELVLLEPEEIAARCSRCGDLHAHPCQLPHGAMHDMAAVTAAAHAKGILCVWDLCHSAGAVPVDLKAPMPTLPWAAATNTSTAAPARRPLSGRIRA
jgi:kynureninase